MVTKVAVPKGCGIDVSLVGEDYMCCVSGEWQKNEFKEIQGDNHARPCGGRMLYWRLETDIRLCMKCAALNGVIW